MPEGHTLHRLARDHAAVFAGRPLVSSSPQGRFADGAAAVDGRVLEAVEAYGKHLLYWFEHQVAVHVHLGLYGTFTTHREGPPAPGPNVRWRFGSDPVVDLVGPTACELWGPDDAAALRARLGPDPLRRDGRAHRFIDAARTRRTPIGAALLDQGLISGVGNVFRAEALFLCAIHPDRPARELSDEELRCLWDTLSVLLRRGVKENRIATVPPRERDRGEPEGRGRHRYVYHRTAEGCRRCGGPVVEWPLGNRRMFACPHCQPRSPQPAD